MRTLLLLTLALAVTACAGPTPGPESAQPMAGAPTVAAVATAGAEAGATVAPASPEISVSDVWARTSPDMAENGAAYMVIANKGTADDKLLGATGDVAAAVEIHETKEEGGMMKMAPVEAVLVPAGGQVELKPGGYHVMLIGMKSPLQAGQKFPLTLRFARAGEVQVEAEVRSE
jgi:periplasmic copper chaperone A